MAFDNTAWLIDGVLTKSELARRAQYAASGGAEGVVAPADLRVLALSTPGNGLRVLSGTASLLNRYTNPTVNQSYVVSNPTTETIDSTRMPAVNAQARSHLVVVTVGDPQYTAAGHPWMPSSMVGVDLNTFQYVRTHILANVPATTTRFEELVNPNYPAYALARIDVPANTTTITQAMIKDLRKTARPRTDLYQWHVSAAINDQLFVAAPGTYEYWPDNSQRAVFIPPWATKAYVTGFIEGFRQVDTTTTKAHMRVGSIGAGLSTAASAYWDNTPGRKSINLGGEFAIASALRGTTQNFQVQATVDDATSQSELITDAWTTAQVTIRFVEEAD